MKNVDVFLKRGSIVLAIFDAVIVLRIAYAVAVTLTACSSSCAVELYQGGCDGLCPSYSITVRDDGLVQYQGYLALVSGEQTWHISRLQAALLISDFFLYGAAFSEDAVDNRNFIVPPPVTCLTIGLSRKCVTAYLLNGIIPPGWIGTQEQLVEKYIHPQRP